MELSEEFREGLAEYFDWEYTNIPNSPSSEFHPFSFAFSLRRSPKCWISHDKVKKVGDEAPNRHPDYKDFNRNRQKFYAYSVRAFENSTFTDIAKFKRVCDKLYANIDQGENG